MDEAASSSSRQRWLRRKNKEPVDEAMSSTSRSDDREGVLRSVPVYKDFNGREVCACESCTSSAHDDVQLLYTYEEVAHEEVAHEEIAHDEVTHEEVAHEEVAHEEVELHMRKVTHEEVHMKKLHLKKLHMQKLLKEQSGFLGFTIIF